MTSTEILDKEFNLIRTDLIKKYDELRKIQTKRGVILAPMRASGQWANTLTIETKGLTTKLFGQFYTEFLVDGRKPGKFPPIAAIEQWIKDKGIKPIQENMKISSLAFLIARKISKEGTEYFKQGGTELIDSVITPARIQGIINQVSVFQVSEFILIFTNELKRLAA